MRNKQKDIENRYIRTLKKRIKILEYIIFGKNKEEIRELKFIYKNAFLKDIDLLRRNDNEFR